MSSIDTITNIQVENYAKIKQISDLINDHNIIIKEKISKIEDEDIRLQLIANERNKKLLDHNVYKQLLKDYYIKEDEDEAIQHLIKQIKSNSNYKKSELKNKTFNELNEIYRKIEDNIKDENTIIVVTPINQHKNSDSNIDYEEQKKRSNNDQQLMWDDTKYNKQKKDGYFIFQFNDTKKRKGYVRIHTIEKVLKPVERLPSWSKNVGQQNRNVLYLSKKYIELDWCKWMGLGGPKKVQGTQHITNNKLNIIKYINKNL